MKRALLAIGAALMLVGCEAERPPGAPPHRTVVGSETAATRPIDVDIASVPAGPLKLGVVELDEIAPLVAILGRLREHHDLFATVLPLPGGTVDDKTPVVDRMSKIGPALAAVREQAAGQGVNTLLVLGSSVDTRSNDTLLGVLDLTIVGIWVVPSRQVIGDGRGVAELVDVASGKVLMSVSDDQSDWTFVPAISASDAEQNLRLAIVAKTNGELVDRMVAKLAEEKSH